MWLQNDVLRFLSEQVGNIPRCTTLLACAQEKDPLKGPEHSEQGINIKCEGID